MSKSVSETPREIPAPRMRTSQELERATPVAEALQQGSLAWSLWAATHPSAACLDVVLLLNAA